MSKCDVIKTHPFYGFKKIHGVVSFDSFFVIIIYNFCQIFNHFSFLTYRMIKQKLGILILNLRFTNETIKRPEGSITINYKSAVNRAEGSSKTK